MHPAKNGGITTANRLAAFVLPLLMGLAAQALGLAYAFTGISIGLLALVVIAKKIYLQKT